MKKIIIASVLFFFIGLYNNAESTQIKNKLNKAITIKLSSGKSIKILPKGTLNISDKDLAGPELNNLVKKGDLEVIPDMKKRKK